MGFLDNSTNNIIVDAVLTDAGREALSKGDGSFQIVKFGFGDDEVDYTLIKKFGRTVGKQKIELNTPIFEAQTNENQALKHMLVTYSDPLIYRLPGLGLTSVAGSTTVSSNGNTTVEFQQTISGELSISGDAQDTVFLVTMDSKFLYLSNGGDSELLAAERHKSSDGFKTYQVSASGTRNSQQGAILSLNIRAKALSQNTFTYYGDTANKSQITTTVSVQGLKSGVRKDISMVVTQT